MQLMKLKIDKEFKELIPPLSDDEYSGLEQNILKNGCLDNTCHECGEEKPLFDFYSNNGKNADIKYCKKCAKGKNSKTCWNCCYGNL